MCEASACDLFLACVLVKTQNRSPVGIQNGAKLATPTDRLQIKVCVHVSMNVCADKG